MVGVAVGSAVGSVLASAGTEAGVLATASDAMVEVPSPISDAALDKATTALDNAFVMPSVDVDPSPTVEVGSVVSVDVVFANDGVSMSTIWRLITRGK